MCAICNFKIEFDIGHPQALSVAVATRAAIEAGMLEEQIFEGPLGHAKLRMSAIQTLKSFQDRLEAATAPAELLSLPDFYVLLIESGTWGFFHATEQGFDPDIEPEAPNVSADSQAERDIVLVATRSALQGVVEGNLMLSEAFGRNLFILDAGSVDRQSLLPVMGKAFPEETVRHAIAP